MKRCSLYLVVLLTLAAASTAVAQKAQPDKAGPAHKKADADKPKSDPAEWAPPEALFFLGIADVGQLWEDFTKTSGYQLMNDKAAEALPEVGVLGAAIQECKQRLATALGVPVNELKNPFDGPLAFYLVMPPGMTGGKLEEMTAGLVASVGDAAVCKGYYDSVVGKLKERCQHDTASAGVEIIDVFTAKVDEKKAKSGDDDFADFDTGGGFTVGAPDQMFKQGLDKVFSGDALPHKLAMCLTDERLVIADTAEHVRAVVQNEKKGATLAEGDDYKALLRNLKPVGPVRFVVNVPRIIDLAKTAAAGSEAENMNKWLGALGAETFGSVVGHCRFGASSYDSKLDVLWLTRAGRAGLTKLLTPENLPVAPPASVTADTCVYVSANLGIGPLLDEIEHMLKQIDPKEAEQFKTILEAAPPEGESGNLRKDLLAHLTGPLMFTLAVAKLNASQWTADIALSSGTKDQAAITKALGNPFITKLPLTAREVQGRQVFDLPPLPPMMMPGIAAAVTADRLIVGTAATAEAALAAEPRPPLTDTPNWKRAARLLPEKAWCVVYIDEHTLSQNLLAAAGTKEPAAAGAPAPDLGGMLVQMMAQGIKASMKSDDLSAAEALLKYKGQKVFAIITVPEGIEFTALELKAEK
jgi:hypothetical protein